MITFNLVQDFILYSLGITILGIIIGYKIAVHTAREIHNTNRINLSHNN